MIDFLFRPDVILWAIVFLSVCCVVAIGVALLRAVWRLWIDHELYKRVERDREARRIYEVAHRIPRPMTDPAAQGFTRTNRRVS